MPETQEHLEISDGTKFEVQLGDWKGDFLDEDDAEDGSEDCYSTVTSIPDLHLPDVPGGGSSTNLGA